MSSLTSGKRLAANSARACDHYARAQLNGRSSVRTSAILCRILLLQKRRLASSSWSSRKHIYSHKTCSTWNRSFYAQWVTVILSYQYQYWIQAGYIDHGQHGLRFYVEVNDESGHHLRLIDGVFQKLVLGTAIISQRILRRMIGRLAQTYSASTSAKPSQI